MTDRLPPHAPEAEVGVLGCCLLSPNETLDRVIDSLREPEAFYDIRHQTIFTALREMWDKRTPIDVVALGQRLKDQGRLDQVGGYAYLSSLIEAVPTAASLEYYLKLVFEKYGTRRMLKTATDIATRCYEHQDNFTEFVDRCEADVLAVQSATESAATVTIKDARAMALDVLDRVEREHQGHVEHIPTGFHKLDGLIRMEPGTVTVIAARPSVGKSALGAQIARQVAERGVGVGIIALEMTAVAYARRMIASLAGRTCRGDRTLTDRDLASIGSATSTFSKLPLWVDESAHMTVLGVRSRLRRMVNQHGVKLGVIDYLQLISGSGRYANREAEVSDVSRKLKHAAKELGIPLIVLAQLNRDTDKGSKPRVPRLSDLRESGSIEADADIVILLHPEDNEMNEDPDKLLVKIIVEKQRDGATGVISTVFHKPTTTFKEILPEMPTEQELGV